MNSITTQIKEEIKNDVKELTKIAIEDGIAANEIDSIASYINRNSVFSKYQKEEIKLIISCSKLLYYDPHFAGEIFLIKDRAIQLLNMNQHNCGSKYDYILYRTHPSFLLLIM
jgi:hypothetical protein